jgi:hypothetical protein
MAEYSEAQTGCLVTNVQLFDDVKELFGDNFKVTICKDHIFCWEIEPYKRNIYVKDSFWTNAVMENSKNGKRTWMAFTYKKAHKNTQTHNNSL